MGEDGPRLTRRRDPEARYETWQVWYDDVRVGTIGATAATRGSTYWTWECGFHTGAIDRHQRSGSAATYEAAHQAFEAAWTEYQPCLLYTSPSPRD